MAELTTLARPYAKAAFQVALQDGALDAWSRMLMLAASVAEDATVASIMSSPELSLEQIADDFIEVCDDELDSKGQNFVRLLAENKRLALLPEVSMLFENLKANQEKSVDVEIATAFEISSEISDKLAQALKARLQRDIKLATSVDHTLLGGAVIRAGDTVIDSSTRGKLNKLAETMNS
ncbi:MAG: F0F1 ATP synthase subunit delta [Gammaproteobacteria bacterium]|jgi:F-type H+-transporting ATPase subunit delta|nr:F0F1 ATP synthase subunit delta [Gammaproteobacteria bacterium]|tara:strand:+ start:280 stop:816 length:537 start_codon:yes stop_codon:yes gene_type:complete